jgi:hypothetical protein
VIVDCHVHVFEKLRRHCPVIACEDMPRILGDNAARAFHLGAG